MKHPVLIGAALLALECDDETTAPTGISGRRRNAVSEVLSGAPRAFGGLALRDDPPSADPGAPLSIAENA